jgi:hypothetical protein
MIPFRRDIRRKRLIIIESKLILTGLMLITSFFIKAQEIPANSLVVIDLPEHSRMANVKDTSYTRILDGLYIPPNYQVMEAFREVAYVGNMEDVKLLKVKSAKPLMLISTRNYEIEPLIDSLLSARKLGPDYPSYVKLPLSLNGKILTYSDRQKLLPALKLVDIKAVKYLDPEETKKKYKETPFGLIEITTTSFK